MNEAPRTEPTPARLDARLVAELPKLSVFADIVSSIHELSDFYSAVAADPFSVTPPAALQASGIGGAAASRSMLRVFNRLLCLRTAELLPAAVRAINESRLVSFALATRGVLETAAVAAYHAELLAVDETATALPENYNDRLRAAVLSGKFDWTRFLADPAGRLAHIQAYEANPKLQPAGAAKSVVEMVGKLAERLGNIVPNGKGMVHFDYAVLSDICHPSTGSNLLFFTEISPKIQAELTPRWDTVVGVGTLLLPCLEYTAQEVRNLVLEFEAIDQRLAKLPATRAIAAPPESASA